MLARLHQFKDRFKPHDYVACFQELLPPVDPDRQQRSDGIGQPARFSGVREPQTALRTPWQGLEIDIGPYPIGFEDSEI